MTTIAPEFLQLSLAEIIAGYTTRDLSRPVPLEIILAAVRTFAAQLAAEDADRHRDERAWLAQQFESLTTETT